MTPLAPGNYDPHAFKALTFYDATPRFRDGADTPRAYLERCLETIAAREPMVQAFVVLNEAERPRRCGRQHGALAGGPTAVSD